MSVSISYPAQLLWKVFLFTSRASHQNIDETITRCVIRGYGPNSMCQSFKIHNSQIFSPSRLITQEFLVPQYNEAMIKEMYLFIACSLFVKNCLIFTHTDRKRKYFILTNMASPNSNRPRSWLSQTTTQ